MSQYRLYESTIKAWTAELSHWHSVLYALSVCKRSAPLYYEFVAAKKWGDKKAFNACHQLLEDWLSKRELDQKLLGVCKNRIEDCTPDTKEYSDSVYACDTGIIHIYALSLLQEFKVEHTYYIARYCYELVDCAAGMQLQPDGGTFTPALEAEIESHPLVQEELLWQAKGRKLVSEIPELDLCSAKEFVKIWAAEPIVRNS